MPRLARICWMLTIVYWCGLFALTHVPARVLPVVKVSDKIEHCVSYGLLAVGLFLSMFLGKRRRASDVAILVLGILLAYGAIDEWTQIPVGRDCELADWFADAAGAGVAVVLSTLLSNFFGT